jgi:molybdopterin synthase sulfur carrier subunit
MATVRYFAAARAATGVETEAVPAGSLKELVEALELRHGDGLGRILTACSFLVDGLSCREPATALTDASTIDVLPPFAGG